ncbi:phospholipase C [Tengunoibacter tsumagoiensis]|uniref:Phospholipase C n=1 Tax=Tengunoibacter tsumagoiensis TaxID=2014871 RepID=A0A402A839_9CHLR|nr:alkaline phosphatase family protein [Tengunoibacter tsumagoiensis]GCE15249.1 phospholipase C [Tengunoibacter tsumagoiensis]
MKKHWRFIASIATLVVVLLSATAGVAAKVSATNDQTTSHLDNTTTPIQHVVVIFQENVSFDHYFGTYPYATNPAGEPAFVARKNTPTVNGLSPALLTANPNTSNPQRIDRSTPITCDQDHAYTDEQKAYDHGLVDQFVQSAAGSHCADKSIVMNYYDGNTTTALWNYAQHFAMSDNSFGTTFGPSTPGALNLISGQTYGATPANFGYPGYPVTSNGSMLNDIDPAYDDCSAKGTTASMAGMNVGDLLNAKNLTWGWFEGGFAPSSVANGQTVCGTTHTNISGATVTDYIPHHEPFQYYQSTSNPHHLPPTSAQMIGKTDQANHQYDLQNFWTAVNEGQLPAVSFLKASAYQDGHAGYSDPLDEQTFLVNTINKLQKSREWKNTAVIISYDDSDGWYDHVLGPIVSQSNDPNDALTGAGACGAAKAGAYQGRCGYGPRLPLMVISPFAKENSVDHTVTDQSSILRFIEDNWKLGRIGNQSFDALAGTLNNLFDFHNDDTRSLYLDPTTGEPIRR